MNDLPAAGFVGMSDATEATITGQVLPALAGTSDPRLQAVMSALVRHLHAFVREVDPGEAECMAGVVFLTCTGKMCSDVRQEAILLSDVLGVTTLVDVRQSSPARWRDREFRPRAFLRREAARGGERYGHLGRPARQAHELRGPGN